MSSASLVILVILLGVSLSAALQISTLACPKPSEVDFLPNTQTKGDLCTHYAGRYLQTLSNTTTTPAHIKISIEELTFTAGLPQLDLQLLALPYYPSAGCWDLNKKVVWQFELVGSKRDFLYQDNLQLEPGYYGLCITSLGQNVTSIWRNVSIEAY